MDREQAVHHAARLIRAASLLVQPRQVQTDPGIAGAFDHGRFQLGLRADRIAGVQKLPRAGALHVGAQQGLATGFGALGRGQPVEQRAGFLQAALAAVQPDQALQRAGIVGIARQGFAIAGFGSNRVAGGLHVTQRHVSGRLVGQQLHRLLQQLARLGQIAARARRVGLLLQLPVAGALQCAVPFAVAGRGRAQQFLRLGKALLTQTYRTQAAERFGVSRTCTQDLGEALFGCAQIVRAERTEAFAQQQAIGIGRRGGHRALRAQLAKFGGHFGIVRGTGEKCLVQRRIGHAGIEPQQRLAPAAACRPTHVRALGQRAQLRDAVAAGGFAVTEYLRQRQLHGRIARVAGLQASQAVAGTLPAGGSARQRLVVLQRQVRRRRLAGEGGFVAARGFHIAPGRGSAACIAQSGIFARAAAAARADRHAQALRLRRLRMRAFELLQALARFGLAPLRQIDLGQAEQCVGLVRVDAEQLLPGVGGQIVAALVVPVVALLHQLLGGAGLRLRCRCSEQAQREHAGEVERLQVVAAHAGVLQAGNRRPSAAKR